MRVFWSDLKLIQVTSVLLLILIVIWLSLIISSVLTEKAAINARLINPYIIIQLIVHMQRYSPSPSPIPRRSLKAYTYHPSVDNSELSSMQRATKRQETMLQRLYSFEEDHQVEVKIQIEDMIGNADMTHNMDPYCLQENIAEMNLEP